MYRHSDHNRYLLNVNHQLQVHSIPETTKKQQVKHEYTTLSEAQTG